MRPRSLPPTAPRLAAVALALVLPAEAQGFPVRQAGTPSPVATGRVWVVDSAGSGDFPAIQGAVDAASDGDTVLVQSGIYDGFSIAGKSLVVVGERDATLLFRAGALVEIEDLGAGRRVALRGLRPAGPDAPVLRAEDAAGLLWIEDCALRASVLDVPAAASFVDCADVVLVACEVAGGDAFALDAHGLHAERSALHLYDTSVTTGEHFGIVPDGGAVFGVRGSDGASGVELVDASLFASGCALEGGDASTFNCPYGGGGLMTPGGSGAALRLTRSDAATLDTTLTAGIGYELFLVVCSPVPGDALVLDASSSHAPLAGTAHRTAVPAPAREGEVVTVGAEGVAGELVFLHDTPVPAPFDVAGLVGPAYTPDPLLITFLGTVPGSGLLETGATLGPLPTSLGSRTLYSQAIFLGGPGASFAGAPTAAVVLDQAVQPVLTDCDGNRVEDALDVALGNAPDCNGNGIPDACDVASGASPDCNADGVPDACEIVVQVRKIVPSTPPLGQFGAAVDVDGDTAVVSTDTDDLGLQALNVHVRDGSGVWPATETAQLLSSDPDDDLGPPVIGGDTIVAWFIGTSSRGLLAWVRDPETGAWPTTETARLGTSDPTHFIQTRYATDGQTIAIDGLDDGVKSIFLYERRPDGTWPTTETAILTTTTPYTYYSDVAVDGDVLVTSNNGAREVFVFEHEGGVWPTTETAVLAGDGGFFQDQFGFGLALDGDTLIVGAMFDNDLLWRSGAAYVFRRTPGGWEREAKLKSSASQEFEYLGSAVALDGDAALLQVPYRDSLPEGGVCLFQRVGGSWLERGCFSGAPLESLSSDPFGESLALSGRTAIASAHGDTSEGTVGSTFLFELVDLDGDLVPDACE